MKAVYIEQYGPIEGLKIREIPKPKIEAGSVLVEVEAAGINPSDLLSFQGKFQGAVLPRVVGRDFAGRIAEGSSNLVGSEVWGTGGDLGISRNGTHADYLAVPEEAVARRPKNLSAEQAAVVGVPFLAAFSALFTLGQLKKGEWVIVSGAAGAVGQAAIQLAKSAGASVIALVKNADELWVTKAGNIDAIARSDTDDLEAVVDQATGAKGADLALNGVGGIIMASLFNSLGKGGRQVVYSTVGGREFSLDILSFYQKQHVLLGLTTQSLDAVKCAAILNQIGPLFESGALKPSVIAERFPLSDARAAYLRVASGRAGKVVLEMPGEKQKIVDIVGGNSTQLHLKRV